MPLRRPTVFGCLWHVGFGSRGRAGCIGPGAVADETEYGANPRVAMGARLRLPVLVSRTRSAARMGADSAIVDDLHAFWEVAVARTYDSPWSRRDISTIADLGETDRHNVKVAHRNLTLNSARNNRTVSIGTGVARYPRSRLRQAVRRSVGEGPTPASNGKGLMDG
jgi:hypothetical protein